MSLNLARDSWYTASCIHNVLIRVISYGWGFTLFIGTAELPKEDDRSPLPLREYLSKLPRDSYVVVKDQVCWLGAKKTNYIVQGGLIKCRRCLFVDGEANLVGEPLAAESLQQTLN